MNPSEEPANHQGLLLAREALAARAQALRDKQWQVFAWSSNLLVGTIGGVIALSGMPQFAFTQSNRLLLSTAVIILTVFSYGWIRHNYSHKEMIVTELARCDRQLGVPTVPRHGSAFIGYHPPVILLALAAIATIWFASSSAELRQPSEEGATLSEDVNR